MSSNNAVAAAGTQGVGWQVDLPSLTSLVLHLSTSALKGFAQAGVDIHTILCMGEIAEKCPASTEYRRELNVCRQKQRKDSIWFHKIVELGSATNFVADELLKTRAGENIIALLSTILPVMPESSCDELILKLFDKAGAPLDKTPGFGQLRSLRETLLPLARKVSFKDHVFRYHIMAWKLLQEPGNSDHPSAFVSIPSEKTAIQIILSLFTVTRDPGLILHYHGLKGSGWVIAYARHVLGLPVCIMSSASESIPINGDYQSARVLVHVFLGDGKFEVLVKGQIQDFFVTQDLDFDKYSIWCLDLKRVDVLYSYLPKGFSRSAVSIIMRSMVLSYTEVLATQVVEDWASLRERSRSHTITYPRYCLPKLHERANDILDLLGCEPQQSGNYDKWSWLDYFSPTGLKRSPNPTYCHLLAGSKWPATGLGRSEQQIPFLVKLVDAAAWLAFSDWHLNVQFLSDKWLERDASWRTNGTLALIFSQLENKVESLAELPHETLAYVDRFDVSKFGHLLSDCITSILVGEYQGLGREQNFQDESMLAFSYRGIIFAQNAAVQEMLDMEALILHLACGTITVAGEPQERIHSVYPGDRPDLKRESDRGSHSRQSQKLVPSDRFPSISITSGIKISNEGLVLDRKAIVDNTIVDIINPGQITQSLLSIFVSSPCEHGYLYDAEQALGGGSTETPEEADVVEEVPMVLQGLCLSEDRERTWLQAVDCNPIGQWLAYQYECDSRPGHKYPVITILQRDCCIRCILSRLTIHKGKYVLGRRSEFGERDIEKQSIRILPGRLKGE